MYYESAHEYNHLFGRELDSRIRLWIMSTFMSPCNHSAAFFFSRRREEYQRAKGGFELLLAMLPISEEPVEFAAELIVNEEREVQTVFCHHLLHA